MTIGVVALTLAALFAGAALYVNLAEHPARMTLSPDAALAQWAPAYARGALMQATLAAFGGISGLAAWWTGAGALFLAGGVVLLAAWPWTLIAIKPVNDRLKTLVEGPGNGPTALPLLTRWARLHAVRTALGLAATALFAIALI